MKRITLLKMFMVPLLLSLSTMAFSQTFTLNNWYALSNYTVTDADDCGTVKKVVANFNNWGPSQFQIMRDGVALGTSDMVSKISDLYYEGSGDAPAWRVRGEGSSWSFTFYINTRVTPYQIVSSVPTEGFNTAKATSSETLLKTPKQAFTLTGIGCSSVDTATFTYQWMKSTDGTTWEKISGATSQELSTEKLTVDSMYYALKVIAIHDDIDGNDTTVGASHEVMSAPILISYKQPTIVFSAEAVNLAHKFNDTEFEVKEHGTMKLTASTVDFDESSVYTLQYKSLERSSEDVEWVDLKTMPDGELANFTPEVSAEYRVKVSGKSVYSGLNEEAYSSEVIVIRKIYQVDTEKFSYDVLWNDDFGYFIDEGSTYVDALGNKYSDSFLDTVTNKSCAIENYWAPDPFGYVKEHQYGAFNPNFINNNRDWCSKYRLEDGYYIITSNAYKGDGKNNYAERDYWESEDHTAGDTDGAMLFVNCNGGLEGVKIYERKLSLNCELNQAKGIWVIFSAYINNAIYKAGSETPVNVRLEIVNPEGKVVYSISSGDIRQRQGGTSLKPESWANLSFRFLAESQDYTIRLYNNAPGGSNWGNDILLDDISVTLCYPKVELVSLQNNHTSYHGACLGETFELVAYNEDGLDKYIGTPKYLFQYCYDQKTWKDYGEITTDSILEVTATEEMVGTSFFRVFVASDEEVVRKLANGEQIELSCATVYAKDAGMVVKTAQPFDLKLLVDTAICVGQDTVCATAQVIEPNIYPTTYFWYYQGTLQDTTNVPTYTYRSSEVFVEGETGDVSFDGPGNYKLEVRAIDDVCQKTLAAKNIWKETNQKTVEVLEPRKLHLSVNPTELSWGQKANFEIDQDGYDGDSLVWYENGGVKKTFMTTNEDQSFEPDQNGEISYYVTAMDGYSCISPSDTVTINVDLVIPNLITPHNDGAEALNNTFLLGKGFHVEIFNRYQQLIYEGEDGWDATYKGDIAEPGTYYYRIFMPNGEIRKGTLEVAKFK